jgi:hypothetical protein
MDLLPDIGLEEGHSVGRDIRPLRHIVAAACAYVGVHLRHALCLHIGDERHLLFAGAHLQRSPDGLILQRHERQRSGLGRHADELAGKAVRDVDGLDEDLLTRLELARVVDQGVGQFCVTWVGHGRLVFVFES